MNFSPVPWDDYRFGVPAAARYEVLFNTDDACWGGSGCALPAGSRIDVDEIPSHGRETSLSLTIPPLGAVLLRREGKRPQEKTEHRRYARMKKECVAMLLAGGQGSRLYVLTGRHGQARRALRRQIPHHRLSPVQLHQLRHRHRGRADPVPAAGAEQLHRQRPALGAGPCQRRRTYPAALPERQRRRLVQGHRQRHLPEHRLRGSVRPGVCAGALRRPHL